VEAGPVDIAEPLSRRPHGDTEFTARDPDGHLLVFSELLPESDPSEVSDTKGGDATSGAVDDRDGSPRP
jgi:hypothetical protein